VLIVDVIANAACSIFVAVMIKIPMLLKRCGL